MGLAGMSKIADDVTSIAKYMKEIEAERMQRVMGTPIEEAKPVETPAEIDWTAWNTGGTGGYGY